MKKRMALFNETKLLNKQYKPILFNGHHSNTMKESKKNETQKEVRKQLQDIAIELNINDSSPMKCPQNINMYRHLLHEKSMLNTDVAWFFNLRNYTQHRIGKFYSKDKKKTESSPPSFYKENIKKFMEKRMKRCASLFEIRSDTNWNNYEHLAKNSFEKYTNPSLVQFGTTLRSLSKPSNVQIKKWDGTPVRRPESSYKISKKMEYNKTFKTIDKYVLRPYMEVIDKAFVGDKPIKRKKLIPNQLMISEFDACHLSFFPYTNNYYDKNIAPVKFIIGDRMKNNSQVLFELGMREYNRTNKEKKKILFKPINQRNHLLNENKAKTTRYYR